MVRSAAVGAHSSPDGRDTSQAGGTGHRRAIYALAVALAAPGSECASQRRAWAAGGNPATAGLRNSRKRMGEAGAEAALEYLRSGGTGPVVPDWRGGLGPALAASRRRWKTPAMGEDAWCRPAWLLSRSSCGRIPTGCSRAIPEDTENEERVLSASARTRCRFSAPARRFVLRGHRAWDRQAQG